MEGRNEESTRKSSSFSRRTAFKVIGGLFAFIPAVEFLINSPFASAYTSAYTPCDKAINVSCKDQRVCSDPDRRGYRTWWTFEQCNDLRGGQNCPKFVTRAPHDSLVRCE
jgi:hypothetical protein